MCDTMVAMTDDGVLFAKNSDREPNEAQLLEWHRAADHPNDARVRATWISLPQVPRTHAILISRPWWMWGAEMGANEYGVAIGNEAVFTKEPMSREPGLLGMDLLRLALERAKTAEEAVQVIVTLLERYGQSGPCSYGRPSFTYHNSFLIADRRGAIVLETAGRQWATEKVQGRARSISNGLTIESFAKRHADKVRGFVARCSVRRRLTEQGASRAQSIADMMAILRDTGTAKGPEWSRINGSMNGPNMHAGGHLASAQTVGSFISDLREEPLHWATGTADPALSLFKPMRASEPCYLGPAPKSRFDPRTMWWRHQLLLRTSLRQWSQAVEMLRGERDEVEARWLAAPPTTEEAVREAESIERRCLAKIRSLGLTDERPPWVRRMWAGYDRAAGLELEASVEAVMKEAEACVAM